jgi:hypothetical protein
MTPLPTWPLPLTNQETPAPLFPGGPFATLLSNCRTRWPQMLLNMGWIPPV